MIFEPGILDMAHKQGIKFLEDINKDGSIDAKDLRLAKAAKAAASNSTSSK